MVGYGIFYVLFFTVVILMLNKWKDNPTRQTYSRSVPIALFAGIFMIRLACAPLMSGHPIDFKDFEAWASHAYSGGLPYFYGRHIFADYPPGYVYVLYVIGFIRHMFGWGFHNPATITLIKLPAITADLITGVAIYRLAKRQLGDREASALAALYLLNPAILVNSTVWAQVDSVFTLFLLFMVLALTARKLPAAAICFAIAVLIKPQSLVFAPLLLFALIERKSWKLWLYSLLYGLAAFVLLLIPFSLYRNPLWIVDQYRSMFGMYPYASLNAFNLYALLGANGLPDSIKWLDIPYKHWDILVIMIVLALSAFLFSQSKDKIRYSYLGMLIVILVFMFKTGMHERYDYPALVLAFLSFLQRKDNRILYLFAGLSLAHFANVAYVLRWSLNGKYLIANHDEIMLLVSLANLIIAVYALKLAFELLLHRKKQAVFPNVRL
ncbi:MAG: hypothetical protein JWR03_1853 [Cohnella sp.]|nr:hypothetical protein [Cohnella sp.]